MPKSFTLKQLAELTDSELVKDHDATITGVDDLESAGPEDASFLDNPRYVQKMRLSSAGVIFAPPTVARVEGKNFLLSETPSLAFQEVVELLIEPAQSGFSNIHPSAVVHPEAVIGEKVSVGPNAVIDRGARIGSYTYIGSGVYVGPDVSIGEECLIYPNAVIRERCVIGNRVILQPGAVIGSCGYGYFTNPKTGKHQHLKHLGIVVLEDDVEIGANTTVDRARFKTTRIRQGTKIDNLVQIAHQVDVGEDNLIVSQTGIAGSSKTGQNVIMAGQVGVVGHITIGDGVILAARTAAIKSIETPGYYTGVPATPLREYNQQMVHFRNLKKMINRIQALEQLAGEGDLED